MTTATTTTSKSCQTQFFSSSTGKQLLRSCELRTLSLSVSISETRVASIDERQFSVQQLNITEAANKPSCNQSPVICTWHLLLSWWSIHTHARHCCVLFSQFVRHISVCVFSLRNRADKSCAGGESGRPAAMEGCDKRKELLQDLLLAIQIVGLFYWEQKKS